MGVYSFIVGASLLLTPLAHGHPPPPPPPPPPYRNWSAPLVDLGYVKYQGYTNETAGINYFRGIRYAANPTGPLRWREPQPIEENSYFNPNTIYNATQVGPSCFQAQPKDLYDANSTFAFPYQGVSEDCLLLDVLTPTHPVSPQLPVIVQIHSGGYTLGNAELYPGDAMVNASSGQILYVSIQYRIGVLGFLAGSEIAQEGVQNAGLLDQRVALEWIQRHISQFGGDPTKVTLWGGSAGGGSITMQMMANGAQDTPPFSAAIVEYPGWNPILNQSQVETQYATVLEVANCADIACLRSLSPSSIALVNQQVLNVSYPRPGYGYGVYYFGPVVDGEFIRELPNVAFNLGHFHDVPLLVDTDAYEGTQFSNRSQKTQVDETTDAHYLFPSAGPAFFSRLYQLYPASNYNSTFYQRQTWWGDYIIKCPTYYMASSAVDHNSNASAVFKLTFAAGGEGHGATAAFLLSNVTGFPSANNETLAQIMTSYWISFAVTHDPNVLRVADAPFWPSYVSMGRGTVADGESVGFATLSVTYTTIGPVTDPDASPQCDFFNSHGRQVQN